jgi:hypothetical protein
MTLFDPGGFSTLSTWALCFRSNQSTRSMSNTYARFALFLRPSIEHYAKANADQYGDSYTTPADHDELRNVWPLNCHDVDLQLMAKMPNPKYTTEGGASLASRFFDNFETAESIGHLFTGCVVFLDRPEELTHGASSDRYHGGRRLIISATFAWLKRISCLETRRLRKASKRQD